MRLFPLASHHRRDGSDADAESSVSSTMTLFTNRTSITAAETTIPSTIPKSLTYPLVCTHLGGGGDRSLSDRVQGKTESHCRKSGEGFVLALLHSLFGFWFLPCCCRAVVETLLFVGEFGRRSCRFLPFLLFSLSCCLSCGMHRQTPSLRRLADASIS